MTDKIAADFNHLHCGPGPALPDAGGPLRQ
jgi:hypothetical protein